MSLNQDVCPECGNRAGYLHREDCWALASFRAAPWLDPYGPNPQLIQQLIETGRAEVEHGG